MNGLNLAQPKNGLLINTSWQKTLLIAFVGNILLIISAKAQIPFWPVPLTLQTFVLLALPLACGRSAGLLMVGMYLFEGAIGLPVFAGAQAGLAYILGPTGGYLVGFLVATAAIGWLGELGWSRQIGKVISAMVIGNVIIYALGVLWLSQFTGWEQVLSLGVFPFLLGDATKILLAALAMSSLDKYFAKKHL